MIETKINKKERAIEVYEDGELVKIFLGKYKPIKVGTHYIDYNVEKLIKKIPVETDLSIKETDTIKRIRYFNYNPNKKEIEAISENGDKIIHKNANRTDWEILLGTFYRNILKKVLTFIFLIILMFIMLF